MNFKPNKYYKTEFFVDKFLVVYYIKTKKIINKNIFIYYAIESNMLFYYEDEFVYDGSCIYK